MTAHMTKTCNAFCIGYYRATSHS